VILFNNSKTKSFFCTLQFTCPFVPAPLKLIPQQ
jgi:hypothetical protein